MVANEEFEKATALCFSSLFDGAFGKSNQQQQTRRCRHHPDQESSSTTTKKLTLKSIYQRGVMTDSIHLAPHEPKEKMQPWKRNARRLCGRSFCKHPGKIKFMRQLTFDHIIGGDNWTKRCKVATYMHTHKHLHMIEKLQKLVCVWHACHDHCRCRKVKCACVHVSALVPDRFGA